MDAPDPEDARTEMPGGHDPRTEMPGGHGTGTSAVSVPDPWSVAVVAARGRSTSAPAVLPVTFRASLAWALGAVGPAALLVKQGRTSQAIVIAAVAALWEVFLRHRPQRPLWSACLVVGGLVVVPLTTWSAIGRAPALVAMVGVLVADAALVDWSPTPSWPRRSVHVAAFAILPVVAAQFDWYRSESIVVTGALLLLGLVVVETYHRFPAPLAAADGWFLHALVLIGTWIGAAVLFVMVAVLLYLPGIIGRIRDNLRRSRVATSYWKRRAVSVQDQRRDAERPFASTPAPVRHRRHLIGAAAVLCVGLVVGGLWWDRQGGDGSLEASGGPSDVFERGREVRFSDLPAYAGVPFADALKDEQDRLSNEFLLPSPVGGYDVADFAGTYTNVTDGERRTIPPPDCDCPRATVWLAGGSAAFGLGQRDEHTIASELVRLAEKDGISLDVRNLGVPGWTLDQERQKVEARLADGGSPDLVVFYDGFNDVLGTVIGSTVHGVDPSEPTRLDTEDITEFSDRGLDPRSAGTPEELGGLAALRYQQVRDGLVGRLDDRGVASLFVFQPDAFSSDRQYRAVESIYAAEEDGRVFIDESLETASNMLDPVGLNLRHLFDDHPDPVFADLVHTNEAGARLVAESMYPAIRAALGLPEPPP